MAKEFENPWCVLITHKTTQLQCKLIFNLKQVSKKLALALGIGDPRVPRG